MSAPTFAPEQDTIETRGEPLFALVDDAAGTSPLDCTPETIEHALAAPTRPPHEFPDGPVATLLTETGQQEHAEPRVRIQPGIAAITALLAFLGWVLHGSEVAAGAWEHGAVSYVAIFTPALLALIAIHEAGHVLAGRLYGHRLISVRIGSKFGVTMLGEHTPRSTAVTAAAGPLIGTLASLAVLIACASSPFSPLWAAAFVALIENVANVGLFFMAGSDGSKIVGALKHSCASHPARPLAEPVPAA